MTILIHLFVSNTICIQTIEFGGFSVNTTYNTSETEKNLVIFLQIYHLTWPVYVLKCWSFSLENLR